MPQGVDDQFVGGEQDVVEERAAVQEAADEPPDVAGLLGPAGKERRHRSGAGGTAGSTVGDIGHLAVVTDIVCCGSFGSLLVRASIVTGSRHPVTMIRRFGASGRRIGTHGAHIPKSRTCEIRTPVSRTNNHWVLKFYSSAIFKAEIEQKDGRDIKVVKSIRKAIGGAPLAPRMPTSEESR